MRRARPRRNGFTLIELVVVIVLLAILASVAVAKFVDLSTTARIASVKSLAGSVRTADNMHALCLMKPSCSSQIGNASSLDYFDGKQISLNWGWPDAGDSIGNNEIDVWVVYNGFTASLVPGTEKTMFSVDGAPDPSQCAAVYEGAFNTVGTHDVVVTTLTSGC